MLEAKGDGNDGERALVCKKMWQFWRISAFGHGLVEEKDEVHDGSIGTTFD